MSNLLIQILENCSKNEVCISIYYSCEKAQIYYWFSLLFLVKFLTSVKALVQMSEEGFIILT